MVSVALHHAYLLLQLLYVLAHFPLRYLLRTQYQLNILKRLQVPLSSQLPLLLALDVKLQLLQVSGSFFYEVLVGFPCDGV